MKNRYYPIRNRNNNKSINIFISLPSTEISIIRKDKITDYFRHIPLCYIMMIDITDRLFVLSGVAYLLRLLYKEKKRNLKF